MSNNNQVHFVSGRNIFSYFDNGNGTFLTSFWSGNTQTYRYQNHEKEFSSLPSSFKSFHDLVNTIGKDEKGYSSFQLAFDNRGF